MVDPEQLLMIDFEKAGIKIFLNVYPTANITGCLFHLAKNIYRQVVNLGFNPLPPEFCFSQFFGI